MRIYFYNFNSGLLFSVCDADTEKMNIFYDLLAPMSIYLSPIFLFSQQI